MDTESFTVYIKTENIYTDIAKDIKARLNTSNYGLVRPQGKNKQVIGFMNDEKKRKKCVEKFIEKIMKEFATFLAKTYSYVAGNNDGDKNLKCTKKFVRKRKLKFEDYKKFLKATQLEKKINHLEKHKLNTKSLRESHNKFIKNNELISKAQ